MIGGILHAFGLWWCSVTNAQQSRYVRILGDSITGESIMKNKGGVWTKWFVTRHGLSGEWATHWLQLLGQEGLPGLDFVLWAANSAGGAWLQRPAEYHDLRRLLHLILHAECGLLLEDAVLDNPHSLRRFLVEAGQQLRTLDICTTNDVERIGHWNKGSRMPDAYDNASGVSELQARHRVLEAFRGGWSPVHEGEFPVQPNSVFANQKIVMVANKKTRSSIPLLWGRGLRNVVCGHVAQVMNLRIMQTSTIYPGGGNGANAADNNGNRICNGCAVPRRMIVPTLFPR